MPSLSCRSAQRRRRYVARIPTTRPKCSVDMCTVFRANHSRKASPEALVNAAHLKVKGQFVLMEDGERLLFLCSPYFTNIDELEHHGMKLSHLPLHDATRDLILLNESRLEDVQMRSADPEPKVYSEVFLAVSSWRSAPTTWSRSPVNLKKRRNVPTISYASSSPRNWLKSL